MLHHSRNFLGYPVFSTTLKDLPQGSPLLVNTINQYSYCIAEKDSSFKKALQGSDVLLPDGIAIVAALRILDGTKIRKIAGADIHQYLLTELNRKSGSCFYLGSSQNTLNKIIGRLAKEYPNVKAGAYSPPYKPIFSDKDNEEMIKAVNAFRPDVLFIGMTAPKQEKWAYEHKANLDTKIVCTIGAVFDFYAGTVERPDQIWIKLGLEWFMRLVKEPKRLWRRYLYFGPVFIQLMLKEKAKLLFAGK